MERPVREIDPGVFLCGKNFSAGVYTASRRQQKYSRGGRLLGHAEQFRLGFGHGQVNLSATLALRRNRTHNYMSWVRLSHKNKKPGHLYGVQAFHTRGGSRTHDPLLRRQLLYPTELLERCGANIENIFKITPIISDFPLPSTLFLFIFMRVLAYSHRLKMPVRPILRRVL